ncbi:MAG: hypothetical protein RMA76_33640 [Deltaproteobacteria bacterium]|jgi:hypothetical protein
MSRLVFAVLPFALAIASSASAKPQHCAKLVGCALASVNGPSHDGSCPRGVYVGGQDRILTQCISQSRCAWKCLERTPASKIDGKLEKLPEKIQSRIDTSLRNEATKLAKSYREDNDKLRKEIRDDRAASYTVLEKRLATMSDELARLSKAYAELSKQCLPRD